MINVFYLEIENAVVQVILLVASTFFVLLRISNSDQMLSQLWRRWSSVQRRTIRVSDVAWSNHTFLKLRAFAHPCNYIRDSLGWQTGSNTCILVFGFNQISTSRLMTIEIQKYLARSDSTQFSYLFLLQEMHFRHCWHLLLRRISRRLYYLYSCILRFPFPRD